MRPARECRSSSSASAMSTITERENNLYNATATLAQIFPPATVLVLLGDQLSTAYQSAQLQQGNFAPSSVTVSDLFAGAIVPGFAAVVLLRASDRVLKQMKKGVSGLQNIQLLKWCKEMGIHPIWNFLIGFPQESADDYFQMAFSRAAVDQKTAHRLTLTP